MTSDMRAGDLLRIELGDWTGTAIISDVVDVDENKQTITLIPDPTDPPLDSPARQDR